MMGCPEYGQLGNGSEGKSLEKAGKVRLDFTIRSRRKLVHFFKFVVADDFR